MKYYIIAGEASGDRYGGRLMSSLYAADPAADDLLFCLLTKFV